MNFDISLKYLHSFNFNMERTSAKKYTSNSSIHIIIIYIYTSFYINTLILIHFKYLLVDSLSYPLAAAAVILVGTLHINRFIY